MKKAFFLLVATAMTVSLAGCFQNPIEAAVEKATEQAVEKALEESGVDIDLDLGGTGSGVSLPDAWPSDVPVPAGKIFAASSAEGVIMVSVEVANESVGIAGVEAIKANGYTVISEQSFEGMRNWALEKDGSTVFYGLLADEESAMVTVSVGLDQGY
jgi:hypothetical protein